MTALKTLRRYYKHYLNSYNENQSINTTSVVANLLAYTYYFIKYCATLMSQFSTIKLACLIISNQRVSSTIKPFSHAILAVNLPFFERKTHKKTRREMWVNP